MCKMRRAILHLFVVLSVLRGVCSTERIYYVRPADVSICPGQPCHTLSYYSDNSHLFFTSNTTLYFLPGEHILGQVIVTDVSNITLAGVVPAENTILQCLGEGGFTFIDCETVHILHLTFATCGTDYGLSLFSAVSFHCVSDLEISNTVVTNSRGFGLLAVNAVGSVHILNSVFAYNTGNNGPGGNAFFMYDGWFECPKVTVTYTLLCVQNSSFVYGESWSTEIPSSGGVTLILSQSPHNINIILANTTLHGNQARYGGNVLISYSNKGGCNLISVSIENCYIAHGLAMVGGGLYVWFTSNEPHQCSKTEPQYTFHITHVHFENNTASLWGGNLYIMDESSVCNQINIIDSSINNGTAQHGGAVKFQLGKPFQTDPIEVNRNDLGLWSVPTSTPFEKRWTISNCDIVVTAHGGGVILTILDFDHLAQVDFIDVRFVFSTTTPASSGDCHVSINYYDSDDNPLGRGGGGKVYFRFQKVHFGYGIAALNITTNLADVFLVTKVELWECTFEENTPLQYSIKLYSFSVQATSAFKIIFRNITFVDNPIEVVRFRNVIFINSTFCNSSTHTSLTVISSEVQFQGNIIFRNNTGYNGGALALFGGSKMTLMPQTIVLFIGNHAIHAGGALMVYDESLFTINTCFYHIQSNHQIKNIRLIFENNTAEYAGDAIFGGSILYCQHPVFDLSRDEVAVKRTWFDNGLNFSYFLFDIRQEGLSVVSSQPYKACLCENDMPNCSRAELKRHLYPGDTFAVSAVVVGQMYGTVPGVVHADFVDSTQCSLSGFQELQKTERVCTALRYTIYSNAQVASLRLRAENTSRISGSTIIEEPYVSIQFLSCPPGFSLGNTGEKQLGKCDCHPKLFRLELNISCNITGRSVYRPSSLWIGQLNNANTTDVIYQHCPFDYCKLKPVITMLNESDQQCNFNRYGILCGACRTTYSLILGGSQCNKCNEWYKLPVLLVAFALLGVILVAFLTLCNLTVSGGTINGLVFYANIVHTTRSIFFPTELLTAPFAIFIAWLNLDFGFEVCFFSGMDTYSKAWLQFVFPAYVWLITFLMIVSSHYSTAAGKIIGRNAVKVLATLFLLSFAKLQRTIIAVMSFTFLNFLDGTRKKVWVYDGNIDYLKGRHIPLFLAGLLAFISLLLPYTLTLTFVQHLRRRTGIRVLFWVRRLKPLFDAYTGPYKDKYSFWVGLLLVVRTSLFLVFAFNALGDPAVNLLAISITGLLLAVVIQSLGGVYKKWSLNALESLSFLNLSVLSQATLYVRNAGGNQSALACISVGVAFLTFVAVLFYHMTFTRVWQRLKEWYSQRKRHGETTEMTELETIGEQVVQPPVRTVELRFDQYREPLLTDVTS